MANDKDVKDCPTCQRGVLCSEHLWFAVAVMEEVVEQAKNA